VRPWQHVLDPLSGYLSLAERLHTEGAACAEAWNFGPSDEDARPVRWVVDELVRACGSTMKWKREPSPQPHETNCLMLDSAKARSRLGWRASWTLPVALERICEWHQAYRGKADMRAFTLAQIEDFETAVESVVAHP
jgi:CDP-glucose 4,6-dehydratase